MPVLAFLLMRGLCGFAQEQEPLLRGRITDVGTGTLYSVDGQPVVCVPGVTATGPAFGLQHTDCPLHRLGEPVQVLGTMKRKPHAIEATRVRVEALRVMPVAGFALVDRVLPRAGEETARLRADGYVLSVSGATQVTFSPGSTLTLATVGTNVWVRYAGVLRLDGTVEAKALVFSPNVIADREDTLRQNTDFDPAAVKEEDRQGWLSRQVRGPVGKELPAYHDAAMQGRLERIGRALIPAYQRQLPAGDPTRIDFRFQLIDVPFRGGFAEPSGVIQVPYQVMEALPDDSQVAAILATDIAVVIEKQALRVTPPAERLAAAEWTGVAVGLFVPGVGLATAIAGAKTASVMEHHIEEQSSRTGLAWMEDAGFDVRQAPVAWWRLADTKGKGLEKTEMPYRTQYLYAVLWREGK